jgi:hypothetical protein
VDHDTLVIVQEAPSAAPLLDLLHLLHRQRLVRPCYVWVAGEDSCRSIANDPRSADMERYDLLDFIRGECEHFGVIHLHLADAANLDLSRKLAEECELLIRDSLSYSEERFRQRLHLVNIVAPSADPGCIATDSAMAGAEGRWTNLLIMPEVQERSDLAVVPVRSDEEYVAHVAANLASIVGLWVGSSLEKSLALIPAALQATSVNHWNLVRTRERVISAPELPDMVVGGVTTTILTSARRGELRLDMVADRDVDRLLDSLVNTLVAEHRLIAVEPPPSGGRGQDIVGLRQFAGILVLFMRTVPARIAEELAARIRHGWQAVLRRLDRWFGTDDLEFRFSEVESTPSEASGPGMAERPIRAATIDAHPDLWAGLRKLAFGLLDGSEPDAPYLETLQRGHQRLILPDPRWCVSPTPVTTNGPAPSEERPTATPEPSADAEVAGETDASPTADASSGTAADMNAGQSESAVEVIADNEGGLRAVDAASQGARAFVDRLLARMEDEFSRSAAMTQQLREYHVARHQEIERRHAKPIGWRARLRRLLRGLWRVVRPLIAIGAIVALVVFLPVMLPIAGLLGGLILAVVYGMVLLLLIRRFVHFLASWFRDEHLRGIGVPELVDLERRIEDAEDQQERFRQLVAVAPEWRDIIRSVVYEPFGPPTRSTNNRIRNIDLSLPDSHKIEEGEATAFRESGIVEVVREGIFSAGWLQAQYAAAVDYVTREQQIAQPGAPFLPDSDSSMPGGRQIGDRHRLVDALHSGRAMRDSRMRLVHQVHRQLVTGAGLPLAGTSLVDWLFTDTSGGIRPTAFLAEADLGTPSEWNRSQLRLRIGQPDTFQVVQRLAAGGVVATELPAMPDAEGVLLGVTPEYEPLLFRSTCLEMSYNVSEESLLAFADAAAPVTFDLARAVDLWLIPPPIDEGEIEVFTDEERDRWGIEDTSVLDPTEVIVPSGPVLAPRGRGPYTFMYESFGRPVPIRRRRLQYMVCTTAAPPNAAEIIRQVLQHTADVTGLEFEYAGVRNTIPRRTEPIDYLFLGWAFNDEYRRYEVECGVSPGTSIGLGGPIVQSAGDGMHEISGGTAVLNAEMALPHAMDLWPNHALVLLHELGHALNLGHVASSNEIMMQGAWITGLSAWGPGDRHGLQLVTAKATELASHAA